MLLLFHGRLYVLRIHTYVLSGSIRFFFYTSALFTQHFASTPVTLTNSCALLECSNRAVCECVCVHRSAHKRRHDRIPYSLRCTRTYAVSHEKRTFPSAIFYFFYYDYYYYPAKVPPTMECWPRTISSPLRKCWRIRSVHGGAHMTFYNFL